MDKSFPPQPHLPHHPLLCRPSRPLVFPTPSLLKLLSHSLNNNLVNSATSDAVGSPTPYFLKLYLWYLTLFSWSRALLPLSSPHPPSRSTNHVFDFLVPVFSLALCSVCLYISISPFSSSHLLKMDIFCVCNFNSNCPHKLQVPVALQTH